MRSTKGFNALGVNLATAGVVYAVLNDKNGGDRELARRRKFAAIIVTVGLSMIVFFKE